MSLLIRIGIKLTGTQHLLLNAYEIQREYNVMKCQLSL